MQTDKTKSRYLSSIYLISRFCFFFEKAQFNTNFCCMFIFRSKYLFVRTLSVQNVFTAFAQVQLHILAYMQLNLKDNFLW